MVFDAWADCERGEWLQLVDGGLLLFKRAHTYRFLAIGQNLERFQKLPRGRTLPSDTHTLYYLTRLTDARYGELIENGTISPSMKRNEASAETRKESKEAES